LKAATYYRYYRRWRAFTMTPSDVYVKNLLLADHFREVPGPVVECGTWKGGMIAGIARVLGPDRDYYLFDSYEGLPDAGAQDGTRARTWQEDRDNPAYFDNCTAREDEARRAMAMTGVPRYQVVKGWFENTVKDFASPDKIAILRLDGDWYDSTMICLERLLPQVAAGGIVILDDYYAWEGCARAVHDYLSSRRSSCRIRQFMNSVAYIINA
jgi:O-methyltransferase